MTQAADVVLGTAWGDEGKGKIVQHLIQTNKYDVCARFNGGPNAGHTIYVDGKKIVTHGIPTGIVYGSDALIGPGCVIDPTKLEKEIQYLIDNGVQNVREKVKIAYNAHLIDEAAIEQDRQSDQVGTTLSGIGPTYSKKALRINPRIADVTKDGKFLGCEVVNPHDYLQGKQVLFEGAQGFLLDPDWGTYPFVTSSGCLLAHVLTSGISPRSLRQIWGVAKLYDTYVGSMEMMPKNDDDLVRLQIIGKEFGATTGRPRQCNWMNLDNLIRACNINGITHLVINKCDIIDQLGIYKLYHHNKLLTFDSRNEIISYIQAQLAPTLEMHFSESPHHL